MVIPKLIRRVMPDATDEELLEATQNFEEYMQVVWEIAQRIRKER